MHKWHTERNNIKPIEYKKNIHFCKTFVLHKNNFIFVKNTVKPRKIPSEIYK